MSTYHMVVCHTCSKKLDLAGYTKDTVATLSGHFALYRHIGHNVSILHDITGWDDEYDKLYDKCMDYDDEISE